MDRGSRDFDIRQLRASDYDSVIAVVDEWWGRPMQEVLPRLFFDHFCNTSSIAEHGSTLAGFLVGFLSPSRRDEAYVHFIGVAPEYRRLGLGRLLCERFFDGARENGRSVVRAITAPINRTSIAFHQRLGFDLEPGNDEVDGIPVHRRHDSGSKDRVLFIKRL